MQDTHSSLIWLIAKELRYGMAFPEPDKSGGAIDVSVILLFVMELIASGSTQKCIAGRRGSFSLAEPYSGGR